MKILARSALNRGRSWIRQTRFYKALEPAIVNVRNRWFDIRHRVQTAGSVPISRLTVSGANAQHGIMYDTVSESMLWSVFMRIPVDHRNAVFVDFGSGKGKALLVAARFPFKQLIGVEFSDKLIAIARGNFQTYRGIPLACRDVEFVHTDASQFTIPRTPAVLYFYNPFREAVMKQVIANIVQSLCDYPRELFLVYLNPELGYLIEACPGFRIVERGPWHTIYKSA